MRWLLLAFFALIVSSFLLLCIFAYNILDNEAKPIAVYKVTEAQEQKVMSMVATIGTSIFSANSKTPNKVLVLNEGDVNALFTLAMKWDRGVQSINMKSLSSISKGYGEDWALVFKEGDFILNLHYQLLQPGIFSYLVGSHINGSMIFTLRYGHEGLHIHVKKLTLSNMEMPAILRGMLEERLIKIMRDRLQKYEVFQQAIKAYSRSKFFIIDYNPYRLQQIMLKGQAK